MAGPAANSELVLYEFLNVITRVSFWRLNPEYGELTMEHQDTILPVPQCLEQTLKRVHPAQGAPRRRGRVPRQDDAAARGAEGALRARRRGCRRGSRPSRSTRTRRWASRSGSTLQALNVIGTFTCTQGSDIVGDDRVGTEFKCRLSVPQAKAAFVNAQKETGGAVEDVSLDFDELLECIARCGVDKYRHDVKEYSFDVMTNQFNQANAGSGDKTLDLAEFLQMVPHIAFWRQNPEHGLQVPTAQRQSPAHVPARPPARAHLPLPRSLHPSSPRSLRSRRCLTRPNACRPPPNRRTPRTSSRPSPSPSASKQPSL